MEVPFGAMKKVVKNKNIDVKLNSIEEVAMALSENDTKMGNYLANEFQFAGSTSVNLNIMMDGIPKQWKDKEYFKRYLEKKFTVDIFSKGLRPVLTKEPKLIKVYENEDKLVLAFSFLGKARRYLEDFRIVTRSQQIVEYVIVHFSPFAIEVRAGQDQNESFREAVLKIMGIPSEEVVWDKATKLNDQQAVELAIRLNAKLRAAKHKMTEGVYATKEVTAKTQVEDLESTPEYKKEFSNQPMKKKTLIFDYAYSFGYEDTISYVITDEGLWIRSKVGEEVISYILDQIIGIKYPSDVDNIKEFVNVQEPIDQLKSLEDLENFIEDAAIE